MRPSTYQQTERTKWPVERSRLRCEAGEGDAKSRFQTSWMEGGRFRWKKVGGDGMDCLKGKVEVEGRKRYWRNTGLEKGEYGGGRVYGNEEYETLGYGIMERVQSRKGKEEKG